MKVWAGLIVSLACVSPALSAGTPPKAIWGKSFVVRATEDRRQRALPDGEWIDRQVSRTVEVYISSAGRVFKRERVVAYGGQMGAGGSGRGSRGGKGQSVRTGVNERVLGEGNARVDASFRGNSILLTVLALRGAGARQTAIQFDESAQSCQATVLQGKGAGTGSVVQRSMINRREIEIESVKTGEASCSVVNGNVFE